MAKKLALGKGIASLLSGTPNELLAKKLKADFALANDGPIEPKVITKEVIREVVKKVSDGSPLLVPISMIRLNPDQPRKIFKDLELAELSQSIKENGVIQPLIVGLLEEGRYDLIAGERRLRASKLANLEMVPVVIKRATERERKVMALIENVQRSDLNCIEEALAYFQLTEDYKLTQEELAKQVGKERSSIANFLRILKLPREVVKLVQREEISFGHAKILCAVKERENQIFLANKASAESLSVRELEKLAKKSKIGKSKKEETQNFYNEQLDHFKQKLEQGTGFHFSLASKHNGSGSVTIKFNNEAEFNDVIEYLLNK